MKFNFKFSNLIGSVYSQGNLIFNKDDNLYAAVGNRITCFNFKKNISKTLPIESQYNITTFALSPTGSMLIAFNEKGHMYMISIIANLVLHQQKFNPSPKCIKFSPDGVYIAIAKGNDVFIYQAPNPKSSDLSSLTIEKVLFGAFDEITCICWSFDSRFIVTGSKDINIRIYPVLKYENCPAVYSLSGHNGCIIECFFETNSLNLYTVCSSGILCIWKNNIESDQLILSQNKELENEFDSENDSLNFESKKVDSKDPLLTSSETDDNLKFFYKRILHQHICDTFHNNDRSVHLTCADYYAAKYLLFTGYSNGCFLLHKLPEVKLIHSISIKNSPIDAVGFNSTGEWIAFGSSLHGQLIVWEWQSETYIMKQQSHYNNLTCLCYSPDALHLATGSLDAKIKLWNIDSGFCVVTFTEHKQAVTGVQFSSNGKFIVSSSLDGTVRASDMIRYRNFRTFTSPQPCQFICLALDPSCELVAAGSQDGFEIYLWSVLTGQLLEILGGHVGPVVSLSFYAQTDQTVLASSSWDKSLRIWEILTSSSARDVISLTSDAFSPDGSEIAVATLNGNITFFDYKTSYQVREIEGRNDLGSVRSETDLIKSKTSLKNKYFSTICYSPDGQLLLAAGQSKNVCVYFVPEMLLLRKFEITQNCSLDAVSDFDFYKKISEFGNLANLEQRDSLPENRLPLPGVKKGDMASRYFKPEINVAQVCFSPAGDSWSAACTEGVLIFSLDKHMLFDPYLLDASITPSSVHENLSQKKYVDALMQALRLNEITLISKVIENIPYNEVSLLASNLSEFYVIRILESLPTLITNTAYLEFYLIWIQELLICHSDALKNCSNRYQPIFHALKKSLLKIFSPLSQICEHNKYTLKYLCTVGIESSSNGSETVKTGINTDVENIID